MTVLLAGFWPGIAGALALGLAIGALAGWPARRGQPLGLGAVALGLGAAALSGLVPGQPGLWLEGAALILPSYGAGCALGSLGRRIATGR